MMDEMGHRLLFLYNHNHVESIHNPHSSSIQWPETRHSPWVNWVLGMNDEFSKQCFHLHKQEQVTLTYYYLYHTFYLPFILKWTSSHALVLPKIYLLISSPIHHDQISQYGYCLHQSITCYQCNPSASSFFCTDLEPLIADMFECIFNRSIIIYLEQIEHVAQIAILHMHLHSITSIKKAQSIPSNTNPSW